MDCIAYPHAYFLLSEPETNVKELLTRSVLHTGIGWEDLPQKLGFRSGMTCWRRIKRWINAGVFDDLHRILLAQLNAANEIDWSRAVIDGSHIDAKKGVPGQVRRRSTAPNRVPSTT